VIDDEGTLRDEVVEWLTLEGYEAIAAEDGAAGLDAAFRYLPDLIVCDITMPHLNGYGVLLEMRANPLTATIPFVLVTARASYDDIRQGMLMGADDYITKPFKRLELLQAIQTRLEKKAAYQRAHQRDVDQLQAALEQKQEQYLLRTKMVAMFSHDFRNPLTSILSSNNLVRDYADRLDEQRRLTHLNRVEASVHQLLHMLDDMLVVAQMETGHLDFKPDLIDVGKFFQQMVEEFQAIHGETHRVLFENRFIDPMWADARLLRQIGANLISNAIKYSPQGSTVRVLLDKHEGNFVLTVQDQGIGIFEADQAHLFEAFQRGSNVGQVPGTGLGLAIVKQATKLHTGTIGLESQLGSGTKVIVTIPMQPGA